MDYVGTFNPWKESRIYSEDKRESLSVFKQGNITLGNVIYIFYILHLKILQVLAKVCKVSVTQDQ